MLGLLGGLRLRIAARKLSSTPGEPEPRWRAVLRIGFGLLWVIDGLLQAQPAMVGLATQVIKPDSSESPSWVRSIVDWGAAMDEQGTVADWLIQNESSVAPQSCIG